MTADYFKGAAVLVAFLGLLLGAYLFGVRTSAPKPEVTAPAAAQSLAGGGLVLARDPLAGQSLPSMATPRGAVVERRVEVKVAPRPQNPTPGQSAPVCPPLTVDLALVRQDGGRRVVASSPDGQIVGGLDVPIEAGVIAETHPWSAGLSVGSDKSPGVWVERDLGRFRAGVEVLRTPGKGLEARARVGWVW